MIGEALAYLLNAYRTSILRLMNNVSNITEIRAELAVGMLIQCDFTCVYISFGIRGRSACALQRVELVELHGCTAA